MTKEDWTADIAEIKTHIVYMREGFEGLDKRFAPKWIVYPIVVATSTMALWALNQLLDLIPKAHATIISLITNNGFI